MYGTREATMTMLERYISIARSSHHTRLKQPCIVDVQVELPRSQAKSEQLPMYTRRIPSCCRAEDAPDGASLLPADVGHLVRRGGHGEPAPLLHLRRKDDRQAVGGCPHRKSGVAVTADPFFNPVSYTHLTLPTIYSV